MINCEKCDTRIIDTSINSKTFIACTNCNALNRTDIFPAAVRQDMTDTRPQTLVIGDDAGCFYHPGKKAIVPCSACGRFLCSLCDIELNNDHICFSCMESGKNKKIKETLITHTFLYDGLALRLSILPLISLIFAGFTCITAPIVIYIVLRYWKTDTSILPRRKKWRFIIAFVVAAAQIVAWIGLVIFLINK